MADCPCCGQTLPDDGEIRIDLDGGFVVANGAVARLTEAEFNLFLLLWQRRPRMVSREALMSEAYWLRNDQDEPEIKIIDVQICKVRKKLATTGIEIDTVWGRGYRILPKAEAGA